MQIEQIVDIWILFKEYSDKKALPIAADRYVELLVDHGISDRDLQMVIGHDDSLDEAISYYLETDAEQDWDADEEYED